MHDKRELMNRIQRTMIECSLMRLQRRGQDDIPYLPESTKFVERQYLD